MEPKYRRVNIMILEEQHEEVGQRGLNLSGLVRDLLGDYLSENVVTIQVGEETRRIYDLLVSNTQSTDEEIEQHLRVALASVLERNIAELQAVHKKLVSESQSGGGG